MLQSMVETWGHRAAESRRQAHSHPGGEAPGRGHCRRSQLCFVPLHPGENPFPPTSAWGPCRCRQLKAAGRGECGAEQGQAVGPTWFFSSCGGILELRTEEEAGLP